MRPASRSRRFQAVFAKPVKLIRVMPNTPALVGASMSALCRNELISEEELQEVYRLFCSFGEAEIIPEKLMDAVVGMQRFLSRLCVYDDRSHGGRGGCRRHAQGAGL